MRISDWSSDVCSSDLQQGGIGDHAAVVPYGGFAAEWQGQGLRLGAATQQIRAIPYGAGQQAEPQEVGQSRRDDGRIQRGGEQFQEGRERPDAESTHPGDQRRSEETTSELQSLMRISYAV